MTTTIEEALDAWEKRLRFKDLGAGATFGLRHVALLENVEITCHRPSDGGPTVLRRAAAILVAIHLPSNAPTWEVRDALQRYGLGAPYGPREGVDPRIKQNALDDAKALLALDKKETHGVLR